MRKVLLASAALVALGAGSAQAAEPIKLQIGGVVDEMFSWVDNRGFNTETNPATTKLTNWQQTSTVLVRFTGSTKLDNGLSVSLYIDDLLNDASSSRNANASCNRAPYGPFTAASLQTPPNCNNNSAALRSYGTLSGGFGSLVLGEREDVTYIFHNSAPDVSTLGPIGDGMWYYTAINPSQHHLYQLDNTSRYNGHTNKVTYISPSLFGVSAGFSYDASTSFAFNSSSPGMASSSDALIYAPRDKMNGFNAGGDAYAYGLAYNNKVGPLAIKADFGIVQNNFANLRHYNGGTQIGFGGFTLGGSFLIRDVPNDADIRVGNTAYTTSASIAALPGFAGTNIAPSAFAKYMAFAGNNWTAGIKYATGPYAVSFAMFHDNTKSLAVFNGTGRADSTQLYMLGANYTMGPGVVLTAGAGYFNFKGDVVNNQAPYLNRNDGYLASTGMRLIF